MCWDYSECGKCGYVTQCIASCYCENDDECQKKGHRDCKSFDTCATCSSDLCDDCYLEKCIKCKKSYCEECENSEHSC